jgi:hypothetical protein
MMRRVLQLSAVLGVLLFTSQTGRAQDVMAEHRIRGLKKLSSVFLVFGVNDKTEKHVFNEKELADFITVALARDVRALTVKQDSNTPDWLELSLILTDRGASVEICVRRWVRLLGTDTDFLATTWQKSQLNVGGTTDLFAIKRTVQDLLTSFAADFIRANQ